MRSQMIGTEWHLIVFYLSAAIDGYFDLIIDIQFNVYKRYMKLVGYGDLGAMNGSDKVDRSK